MVVWRHDVGPIPVSVLWPYFSGGHFRMLYDRLSREGSFDLVNVHCCEPDHPLARIAEYAQLPCVATFHASWLDEIAFEAKRHSYSLFHWKHYAKPVWIRIVLAQKRHTERAMLNRADRVVVLSRFVRGRVEALHGVPAAKIRIVPSGVDAARFSPCEDRATLRRRLNLPDDKRILFTARRLVARTGVEELVEAMERVAARRRDVLLLIAGKGYLLPRLEQRVAELGLAPVVRLLGYVDSDMLVDLYRAADLFILPTVALEGFGIATIEALACGVPVLGTRVGATPEILDRIDPSLVVDDATHDGLADGILRWLSRPEKLEALRPRCREVAVATYGWDGVAAALERVFDETSAASAGADGCLSERESPKARLATPVEAQPLP